MIWLFVPHQAHCLAIVIIAKASRGMGCSGEARVLFTLPDWKELQHSAVRLHSFSYRENILLEGTIACLTSHELQEKFRT
jgi:hypothetical protein